MSENNREAELIADIEALTADRDHAVRERNRFLLQRNDLLAALADLVEFADHGTTLHPGALVFDNARAAIAKATGAS